MTDTPRVSVVIVSKDEPQLAETLATLRRHVDENEGECIVVDASRKRLNNIRVSHPWVRWIDFVGPLGVTVTIAHQRNVGVNAARAEIIAFCDSGGVPMGDWLSELITPLTAGQADATCGPIFSLDSPFMGTINELPDGAPIRITVTANMAVKRSVFNTIGPFDERFAYGEDTEFGWRMQDAHLRVVCAARARMSMRWGDSAREVIRGRHYGQGTAMLFVTHPNRIPEQFAMWPDLLAYPAWLVGFPISLALGPVSWWIPVVWTGLLVLPVYRALRTGTPGTFLRVKWVRSVSFFQGLAAVVMDQKVRVVFITSDQNDARFSPSREQLAEFGVRTEILKAASRCLGLRLVWRRLRGVRIVDLRNVATLNEVQAARRWVTVLRLARWSGLRVVAWDRGEIREVPWFADVLVVASSGRRDELLAHSNRNRSRVVTIPGDRSNGTKARNEADAVSPQGVAASVRRLYESLLGIEVVRDSVPEE
ncbi:MAG TPA: glycosyltransferase family 2 protein [Acidimicrobiales bacterium]|nr:glycosyltransferase family 2 protein [Acidimicrobiales bacterium]